MKLTTAIVAAVLLGCLGWGPPSSVLAAKQTVEIGPNDTMNDVLQRQVGLPVEIKLNSGEVMSGRLVRVTPNLLHLSKITGRNYFDAVVRIDQVSAVIVQVN